MIHTVELRTKSSDFSSYLKFKENPDLCHSYAGITITPYKVGQGKGKYQYRLKAKINLSRTIYPDNYLAIYTGKDADQILNAIEQAFSEMDLLPTSFWTLARVDFTIDIRTPYVSQYLQILAHGDHKYKPQHKNGSLYMVGADRGVIINFYSKEAEQKTWGEEAAEKAKNILRIEVQCLDKRLAALFSRNNAKPVRDLPSMLTVNNGDPLIDMVNETIGKHILSISGLCDHISTDAAIAKIQQSKGLQERTELQLIHLIKRINRKNGSISIARDRWCKETKTAATVFKARMKALYDMGINPICTPPGCPVNCLESLYQLYLAALVQEYEEAQAENYQNQTESDRIRQD